MVHIDSTRCTGCEICVDVCPQKAITIDKNIAVIQKDLCNQCGICAATCPTGAIREAAPARVQLPKGGEKMVYGYGRGFGFRGTSSSWPYVGRGRGGLPRCWYPGLQGVANYPAPAPYWPLPNREQELELLKEQAAAMKRQLEDVESRIKELEKKD